MRRYILFARCSSAQSLKCVKVSSNVMSFNFMWMSFNVSSYYRSNVCMPVRIEFISHFNGWINSLQEL